MESKRDQFTIVPVLVGALKEGKEAVYGKLFSTYLADPQNLFVVSSDFCHWGNAHLASLPLPQYLSITAGKRFRFSYYNQADGPIHSSIEKLDRAVSTLPLSPGHE